MKQIMYLSIIACCSLFAGCDTPEEITNHTYSVTIESIDKTHKAEIVAPNISNDHMTLMYTYEEEAYNSALETLKREGFEQPRHFVASRTIEHEILIELNTEGVNVINVKTI